MQFKDFYNIGKDSSIFSDKELNKIINKMEKMTIGNMIFVCQEYGALDDYNKLNSNEIDLLIYTYEIYKEKN